MESETLLKKSIDDYIFIKSIGEGAYGKVYLAQQRPMGAQLMASEMIQDEVKEGPHSDLPLKAIKVVNKLHVQKFDKQESVVREKEILLLFKG